MDNGVDPFDRAGHGVLVADVSLDDLDIDAVEVGGATAREIVERPDLRAACEQPGDEVRPDEAARAGDESSSRNL
jgi:hypothetical protein